MATAPRNKAAPNASFYTPQQSPPAGTALSSTTSTSSLPTLFTPITIRSHTFQNRIWVAPMCMYSASAGQLTPFHLIHLAAFAYRGASLTYIEATGVQANGRITPECPGLWDDAQIEGIARIADLVHSQGQKLGIQLAHAGRKASTVAPWLAERGRAVVATADVGGWPDDVVGLSPLRWGEGYAMPREMSVAEIREVVRAFADAARRAVRAGVDVIEIHAAHGYLLCSSLSPISNARTDAYGGSFEKRIRMLVETVQAVRAVMPESMPLCLRVSSTEWMEESAGGSWTVDDTIRLAKLLPALGVDLLDCSSGGNHPDQKIAMHNDFQVGIAGRIREALHASGIRNLLIGCVGMITEAEVAREAVQDGRLQGSGEGQPMGGKATEGEEEGTIEVAIEEEAGRVAKADVVLVARQFLREPEWVLRVAYRLGVKVQWPQQYHRGTFLKGSKI